MTFNRSYGGWCYLPSLALLTNRRASTSAPQLRRLIPVSVGGLYPCCCAPSASMRLRVSSLDELGGAGHALMAKNPALITGAVPSLPRGIRGRRWRDRLIR